MKKYFCLLLPCICILALCLLHNSSSSLPASTSHKLLGRRLVEELGVPASGKKKFQSSRQTGVGFGGRKHDDSEGMIYDADYRGVALHPSPQPKHHPKP